MDIPRDMQDLLNRQTHVQLPDGREQENLYDGEGLRAGLTENGKNTTFLFYNGEILAECNGDSMPIRRHLSGVGLSHVQNLENNTFHAYHQDEQGSTAYVTGTTGETENLYSYDGFGNLLESREDIANRILYTGQQYDQETGQYYLRARYYNPVIGRFTQEDTYRGDGLNLYAYCDNNPVMYYDPSGHQETQQGGCKVPGEGDEHGQTQVNQVDMGEQGSGESSAPSNTQKLLDGLKDAEVEYKANPVTGEMEPYMKQYQVNDDYKALLRRDFGDFNHGDPLGDHWNLEIQTTNGRTVYDLHIYPDGAGNILPITDANVHIPSKSPFNNK